MQVSHRQGNMDDLPMIEAAAAVEARLVAFAALPCAAALGWGTNKAANSTSGARYL
jgi:hypothetical protein